MVTETMDLMGVGSEALGSEVLDAVQDTTGDSAAQDSTPQDSTPQDSVPQSSIPAQYTTPPPRQPPLFTIGEGDVIISIMPGAQNEFRVSSAILNKASQQFCASLATEWEDNKTTCEKVCLADGTFVRVKRLELEFDNDGSFLTGKVGETESSFQRRKKALAVIDGPLYSQALRESLCNSRPTMTGLPWTSNPDMEWMTVIAMNYLGFIMLCKLPLEHKVATKYIQRLQNISLKKRLPSMTCIVRRMLQWVDEHRLLDVVRHQFAQLVIHVVPEREIKENRRMYLRLASLLRDSDLLAHSLDNDLMFGKTKLDLCDLIDSRLGLDRWFVECCRGLTDFYDLSWSLMGVSQTSRGSAVWTAASRAASLRWADWILELRGRTASDHRKTLVGFGWSHTHGLDLALAVLERAQHIRSQGFDVANTHPYLTEAEAVEVEDLLQTWHATALDQIRMHLNEAPLEKGGFRLNYDALFQRSRLPWSYRDQADGTTRADDEVVLSKFIINDLDEMMYHETPDELDFKASQAFFQAAINNR